ncbi:MAG: methyltransferase [Planctomycetes bacterium]|nr:methyltransferase [Planctomycetota bacterium]
MPESVVLEYDEWGLSFVVEGDAWRPTPHGETLAHFLWKEQDLLAGKNVLELGAGCAIHTALIAKHQPESIVATEILPEFLENTRENLERNEIDVSVDLIVADWLNLEGSFDAIVTNPPFARSGKQNRRYFIDDLILNAHKRLNAEGELLFIQSSMADIPKSLARLDENGFEAEVVASKRFPFRDYYYEDPSFLEEAASVEQGFERVEGKEWETLSVIHAKLRPFTPPDFAHALVED